MSVPPFSPEEKSRTERADGVADALERGLRLVRRHQWFEAHEAFEEAWRTCERAERDFFQGLVHIVVAWYQAGRSNRVGFERQLDKAVRRLHPFRPTHRGLDVDDLLRQADAARRSYPDPAPFRVSRARRSPEDH